MRKLFIPLTALVFTLAACGNNPSTTTDINDTTKVNVVADDKTAEAERNKATAMACVQAFNKQDINEIVKTLAPGFVDYGDGSMAPVKGVDSAKSGIEQYLKAFPDLKGDNFKTVAEGNQVVVFGEWGGTFKNELGGIKPTGKSYKINDADIFTFNNEGKITEHRCIQSMQTVWSQLGVSMSQLKK